MKTSRRTILLLGAALTATIAANPQTRGANWDALVDRFFDEADFRFNPSAGTSAGFHQYDDNLEDFSVDVIRREVAALHQYEGEFRSFPADGLTPEQRADR